MKENLYEWIRDTKLYFYDYINTIVFVLRGFAFCIKKKGLMMQKDKVNGSSEKDGKDLSDSPETGGKDSSENDG